MNGAWVALYPRASAFGRSWGFGYKSVLRPGRDEARLSEDMKTVNSAEWGLGGPGAPKAL